MFCTKCGAKIPEGNNFCNECGSPSPLFKKQEVAPAAYSNPQPTYRPLPKDEGGLDFTGASSAIKKTGSFFYRIKWVVLVLLILAGGGITVYKVFIESKPENDAAEINKMVCDCDATRDKEIKAALQLFNDGFENNSYKTRSEASNAMEKAKLAAYTKRGDCIKAVQAKANEYQQRYEKNYTKLTTYTNLTADRNRVCTNTEEAAVKDLDARITEKINKILEAEPTDEIIKKDLIGKNLPGYSLQLLSQITEFGITNKIRVGDRIEYTVAITINDASNGIKYVYPAAAIVYQLSGNGSWYQTEVIANEYRWDVTCNNTWKTIKILTGTTYTLDTHGSKGYVKDDSYYGYGSGYKIGPDGESVSLHSNNIYLASRESGEVMISLNIHKSN